MEKETQREGEPPSGIAYNEKKRRRKEEGK